MFSYVYSYDINPEYLVSYLEHVSDTYGFTGVEIKNNREVYLYTAEELTDQQKIDLTSYLDSFTNTSTEVLNSNIMEDCVRWGRLKIDEFKTKNMDRKNNGLMSRQELYRIMQELHESLAYMCLLEGSLDTLHGILNGFTATDTEEAIAPYNFQAVWAEDIEWFKTELNEFLGV